VKLTPGKSNDDKLTFRTLISEPAIFDDEPDREREHKPEHEPELDVALMAFTEQNPFDGFGIGFGFKKHKFF